MDAFEFGRMVKQADGWGTGGFLGHGGYVDHVKDMYGRQLPNAMKNFYEWGSTPIGAHSYAKEHGLSHLPYPEQTKAWEAELAKQPPQPSGAEQINKAVADYWQGFKEYGYNNPVWKAFRGAGRFIDASTEPKNKDAPLTSGWNAMMAGDEKPAVPAGAAAPPPADTPAPTFGQYLGESFQKNPLPFVLGGLGVGGLGAYGIYNMMAARREKKERLKRLAAIRSGIVY